MSNYQLISFDMDGTLLPDNQILTEKTKNAIHRAITAGKTVIISTGRTPAELQDYEADFKDIRYYVCANGALIYDSFDNKIISATYIPQELVQAVMEITEPEDTMLYLASNGQNMATRQKILQMEHYSVECYKDLALRTGKLHDNIYESYRRAPFPIEKLNVHSHTAELRDRLLEKLIKLPLTVVYADGFGLELSPLHISKAVGFRKLCDYLSVDLAQTIAVGDSDNDVEILKTAGLAIAMGNARSCAREVSDVIVADNNHDGCAQAIDEYLLTE